MFAACLVIAVAAPAGATSVAAGASEVVEVVVKLDPTTGASIEDVNATYGTTTVAAVLASRGIYLVRGSVPGGADDDHDEDAWSLAEQIDADLRVSWAEPNFVADSPEDTRFHAWASTGYSALTDTTSLQSQPAFVQLGLAQVHQQTRGAGVVVAVLDTGADLAHPALSQRVVAGWDYVDDDQDPTDVTNGIDDDSDGNVDEAFGHGTHVAAVAGIAAPDASILVQRVLNADGTGNVFIVAQAIFDAVDRGAKVINLSFGLSTRVDSNLLQEAFRHAAKKGAVVVAAAGNDGGSLAVYPAASPGVVSVTSLGPDAHTVSGFANYGYWVKVAAPGENVVSAVPGGSYATWSGTSMATPWVAGEAALLRSLAPGVRADTIQGLIYRGCTSLNAAIVRFGAINPPASVKALTGA